MGTTVTAAHVGRDSVTIAHVGDSRCYLVRDDTLTRLTRDHSLVEELVARGKLTPEQAETHPQRSVITRALGPEANVQVDIISEPAQAGDLFLVCSDGLTSMVREPNLKPLLIGNSKPLDELGRSLIAAANEAGGRDNITVILFKLDEVEVPAAPAAPPAAGGGGRGGRAHRASTTPSPARRSPRRARAISRPQGHTRHTDEDLTAVGAASDTQEHEYRASGTVALSAVRPRAQPIEEGAHAPPRRDAGRRRKRRRLVTPGRVLVLGCIIGLLAAFWLATRQVYFVGVDDDRGNVVTVYHGLPYDLPLGIRLYSPVRYSGVTLQNVPARRRPTFTDHKLRSKNDAEGLVGDLEAGRIC